MTGGKIFHLAWQVEGEGTSHALGADHAQFTTEKMNNFSTGCKSKAGAAILATSGSVGPLASLEDELILAGRNVDDGADARLMLEKRGVDIDG